MNTPIKIASMTDNRVRIKVQPGGEEGALIISKMQQLFSLHEHLKLTRINPHSRSIILEHANGQNEIKAILHGLNLNFSIRTRMKAKERLPQMRKRLKSKLTDLDIKIQNFTDGELDLDIVIGSLFIALSGYKVIKRGSILPSAEVLLANGLKHYTQKCYGKD